MDAYALVKAVFDTPFARWVVVLLLGNLVSGIGVTIAPNNPARFKLGALGDWFLQALVYLLGGATVRLVWWAAPEEYRMWATMLDTLVWGLIIAALVGKILANLKVIFPKAPIPDWMTDKPRPEVEAKP